MLFSGNSLGQQLNIYPTIVNFQLSEPGSVQTQTINITNNSDKKQTIESYFGDWNRKEDGGHEYFEGSTQPFSCAGWAQMNTNLLEIAPGESTQLILTLKAPEDPAELEKMKWCMLFLQGSSIKEAPEASETQMETRINEIIRFGIHVYQTPAKMNLISAVAQDLNQNEENPEFFFLDLENNGQVMVKTKSYLELTNINTGAEFRGEIAECPIFPLGKRKVSLQLPAELPAGKYSLLAIMDYGDPNSLEAIERIIEIK